MQYPVIGRGSHAEIYDTNLHIKPIKISIVFERNVSQIKANKRIDQILYNKK
jgi:hypothetical protein